MKYILHTCSYCDYICMLKETLLMHIEKKHPEKKGTESGDERE